MEKRETPRKSTMLRLEADLYDELAKIAKAEDRSVNNLVVQLIKKYVKDKK